MLRSLQCYGMRGFMGRQRRRESARERYLSRTQFYVVGARLHFLQSAHLPLALTLQHPLLLMNARPRLGARSRRGELKALVGILPHAQTPFQRAV